MKGRERPSTNSSASVEKVVAFIDWRIGAGALQPGDSVSEPEIGAALGVGRVPVREALRILAGEGVLELIPNRGAKVRVVRAQEVLEMLEVLTGLSVTAMHRLTAGEMDQGLVVAITRAADDIGVALETGDPMIVMKKINIFHDIVISGCGNDYLRALVKKTRILHYSRYLVDLIGLNAFKEAAPVYPKIAAALAKRDAAAASRLLLKSVERSMSYAQGRRLGDIGEPSGDRPVKRKPRIVKSAAAMRQANGR